MMLYRLLLSSLCFILTTFSATVWSMEIVVLASNNSDNSATFIQELLQSSATARHQPQLAGNLADGFNDQLIRQANLLITIGLPATQYVQPYNIPTLAVMVSQHQLSLFCAQRSNCGERFSAIVMDQPIQRQINLIRIIKPEIKKVGLLINASARAAGEEFARQLSQNNIQAITATLHSADDLLTELKSILPQIELYLASPEIIRITPFAARTVLLTSYRYHQPVFAFSKAYVNAGATAAVFSTPENIAQDVAQWLHQLGDTLPQPMPPTRHPRHFQVATNRNVGRTLNLELPKNDVLLQRLQALEELAP